MRELLIWGQVQTGLYFVPVEQMVILAPCHIGQARQIGQNRCGTILPIQAQDDALWWELVALEVAVDGCYRAPQFGPVLAVACVAEGAEPLMGVGLQGGGAGADKFSALTPQVARRTERTQAALGGRPVRRLGQGPLPGCLARPIDIKDEPLRARSIPQASLGFLCGQPAREQIGEKHCPQRFDCRLVQRREPARARRARRQAITLKERQEGASPGPQPRVEGFERPFATAGIAEEDGDKIDDLEVPKAVASKAHLRTDGIKGAKLAETSGRGARLRRTRAASQGRSVRRSGC